MSRCSFTLLLSNGFEASPALQGITTGVQARLPATATEIPDFEVVAAGQFKSLSTPTA